MSHDRDNKCQREDCKWWNPDFPISCLQWDIQRSAVILGIEKCARHTVEEKRNAAQH